MFHDDLGGLVSLDRHLGHYIAEEVPVHHKDGQPGVPVVAGGDGVKVGDVLLRGDDSDRLAGKCVRFRIALDQLLPRQLCVELEHESVRVEDDLVHPHLEEGRVDRVEEGIPLRDDNVGVTDEYVEQHRFVERRAQRLVLPPVLLLLVLPPDVVRPVYGPRDILELSPVLADRQLDRPGAVALQVRLDPLHVPLDVLRGGHEGEIGGILVRRAVVRGYVEDGGRSIMDGQIVDLAGEPLKNDPVPVRAAVAGEDAGIAAPDRPHAQIRVERFERPRKPGGFLRVLLGSEGEFRSQVMVVIVVELVAQFPVLHAEPFIPAIPHPPEGLFIRPRAHVKGQMGQGVRAPAELDELIGAEVRVGLRVSGIAASLPLPLRPYRLGPVEIVGLHAPRVPE